jgi:type I restriction enzyme R subunit
LIAVFTKYSPQARAVLDALLEKYRDGGVLKLDDANVLRVTPFTAIAPCPADQGLRQQT